jgi:hypothetical protein
VWGIHGLSEALANTKTRATKALRIVFPYAMVRLVSLDP